MLISEVGQRYLRAQAFTRMGEVGHRYLRAHAFTESPLEHRPILFWSANLIDAWRGGSVLEKLWQVRIRPRESQSPAEGDDALHGGARGPIATEVERYPAAGLM
jgi:hypothetical protein